MNLLQKMGCFAAVLGSLQATQSSAQDAPVSTSIVASHDSNVSRVFNFNNYGNNAVVDVDGYTKPELGRGLVRFDQAAITAAVGANKLMSATLVLTQSAPAESTGTTPTMDVFRLNSAWNEGTVTWASIFGLGEPFDTARPSAKAVVPNGATGTVSFDVSQDVAKFLAGTANNGWVIKDDGYANGVHGRFVSSESPVVANRPKLIIQTLVGYTYDTPIAPTFGAPGSVTIDGSTGKSMIELPPTGKTFATRSAFHDWMVANLNAQRVLDASGQTIDVEVHVTEIGNLAGIDSTAGEIFDIGEGAEMEDAVEALLGGQNGIMTVAGTPICVRTNGCEAGMAAKAPAPAIVRSCESGQTTGNYCIRNRSVTTGSAFTKAGTKVEQKEGGYHETKYRCWPLAIVKRCTRRSGHNELYLKNQYFKRSGKGKPGKTEETTKTDVTIVQMYMTGSFWGPNTDYRAVCSRATGENDPGIYPYYSANTTSSSGIAESNGERCDPGIILQ